MSTPKKFLFDVWLAQGKTVYRDVPYEVVTDWLQQGRLLGDDRIRPAKTEEWFLIDKVPAFAAFVPHADPLRTDAKAEALEPVETGFAWSHKGEEEEGDPDMIPLIDVSLVLLIFFMMTSTVASIVSNIRVPLAVKDLTSLVDPPPRFIAVGMKYIGENDPVQYSLSWGVDEKNKKSENFSNKEQMLAKIEEILRDNSVQEIRVAADERLSFDLVREIGVALEQYKTNKKAETIHTEVGEKK